MFTKLKNIDSAFRQMRLFCLLFIICCFGTSAYFAYKGYEFVTATQQRIYILANGKALEAYASDRKDNISVEARDHVKMFHKYFFSYDPDEKVIQTNISKALYLADASAKRQYDNLRENGYFSNLIAGNISQEIQDDSIVIRTDVYPYLFRYYGKQQIIRPSTIVVRSLVTEGYLRNVTRSDNNSHGFLIERWQTLENQDISSKNR